MSHTELIIDFALSWSVYMLIYVGIGFISVIELIIFYLYHKMTNMRKKKQKFQLLPYLIMYPPIFKGLVITVSLISFPMIMVSYIMTGTIFDYDFC